MIITPSLTEDGVWRYRVEYDDGRVDETAEAIPSEFGKRSSVPMHELDGAASEHLLLLIRRLGVELRGETTLQRRSEFQRMVESPLFHEQYAELSGVQRWRFVAEVLWKVDDLFKTHERVAASDSIPRFVNVVGNRWVFEHWRDDVSADGRMLNFASIMTVLNSMNGMAPAEPLAFLERIAAECRTPMECIFTDRESLERFQSVPILTMYAPHALTQDERRFLEAKAAELKRELGANHSQAKVLASAPPRWKGTITDFVFLTDMLRRLGLLEATDAELLAHWDIPSEAGDRAKGLRTLRSRLKDDTAHPSEELLQRLIAWCQERLDRARGNDVGK